MNVILKNFGGLLVLSLAINGHAAGLQTLHGHVPAAASRLQPLGDLSGSTNLQLAIGLPLRNTEALTNLLAQIYDPASPQYRHYLTPDQFARQFGPTEADYQAVADFAAANGLKVTATHPNRMLIDVSGSVADIERAFHVTMRVYQHPTEHRAFFAPDKEPSVDLAVPLLKISGLDNYSLPRPRLHAVPLVQTTKLSPLLGSGPQGTYMGNDFRAAYVPNSSLRGEGQAVGLLQFDGYTPSDISNYEAAAGLPSVTLSNVLIDGFSGQPSGSGGEVEVSLDIEMAISMAPGLSQVILYEAPNPSPYDDILNRMVTDNAARQLSSSWFVPGGGPDPLADQIFQQMAAQGQSFLAASGDFDAWAGPIDFPDESPFITTVGGTMLTTAYPGGPWASETVWNRNNGVGSAGGISTRYSIPAWQLSVSMAANQGSSTMRDVPDVALTAENVYVRADGTDWSVGGTSCASPLWAGFTALVNQQAALFGKSPAGFLNPTVYQIGTIGNYTSSFHDITNGDNTSGASPNEFFAVPGYDLCTGWGTPMGQPLIDAFIQPPPATPPSIVVQPPNLTVPTTGTAVFYVTAVGSVPLSYAWSFEGTNIDGATNGLLTLPDVQPNQAGLYSVQVTNAFGAVTSSNALLTVEPPIPPVIVSQPQNQTVSVGSLATFSVVVTGTPPSYQWTFDGTAISGATNSSLVLFDVQSSNAGLYAVAVTNAGGWAVSSNATLTVLPLGTGCDADPDGLIGWWAAEGNAYNAVDGTYGQLEGGLNFVPGEVGEAFNFNGIDADVKMQPSTNVNVLYADGFTIEAWINPAEVTTNHPLVEWGIPIYPQNGLMLWISIDPTNGGGGPGSLVLDISEIPFIDNFLATPPGLITSNVWQHVAATYDKQSGIAALYIDGSLITATNFGALLPWSTEYLLFGLDPVLPDIWGAQDRYVGQMDEIAIYNRGLSASEIQANYSAGTYGMCPIGPSTVSVLPTNQICFAGSNATFTAFGSGTPPLSYQWSFDGTNVPGANSASLTLSNIQPTQSGEYSVQVSNSAGSLTSTQAFLTVLPSYPAWNPTTAPTLEWTGVACSADGMKIVAVSYYGQIYTSTNFGITWISNNAPALTWESVACSSDGSKIVAGAGTLGGGPQGGIYGSTNFGATWQPLTNGNYTRTLCSADGNTLLFTDLNYLYTSTNFGASWLRKPHPPAGAGVTACSTNATTIVAGNGKAIFVSTNFGATWNSGVTLTTSNDTSGAACSSDGTRMYCGVFGGYFFSSTNSGSTWTALSEYGNWDAVASSANGAKLAIIRDFGLVGGFIYTSSDSGMTRSPANAPTNNWAHIACSADGNKLVAVAGYPSGPIYTFQIPTLYESFSGNQLYLSWFTNASGFTLQANTDLISTNWVDITNNITVTNWFNQVVLSPSTNSFYRLKYH